ncbi:MAG TPA: right-handed parallel beta-helix repeat-containing protein [Vicinamibacterales bacterium]|nr:right-handed parallel beta-helix repeat-containing protein [Vicinamibacterales bacterium]
MRLAVRLVAAWVAAVGLLPAVASAQSGVTFVVTSTGDGADSNTGDGVCATAGNGPCTLRAAIQQANAVAGTDTIHFAIGTGLQRINVGSALPIITSPVVLDGTTQPGFVDRPLIEVNGNGAPGGIQVTAGSSTLRGLAVTGFSGDGITLKTKGGNVLEMNYVGLSADGDTGTNTGHGVVMQNSPNNRIGGPAVSQRNVISNNKAKGGGGGIVVDGSNGAVIQGNFIGVDVTGMLERSNEARGIAVIGSSNLLIGGPGAGMGNLIAGNRATGVRMLGGSSNNIVQGNFLGVNRTVTDFIANDRGVQIRGGSGHQILGNVIAGNTYDGVLIWEDSTDNLIQGNLIAFNGRGPIGDPMEAGFNGVWIAQGLRNRIVSNSIHSNGLRGIDLGTPQAITPNDLGDGDSGPNNFQNFPVFTSVTTAGGATRLVGTLNSTANGTFLVQLFADTVCDPAGGHGEGRYALGQVNVVTNGAGNGAFDVVLPFTVPVGFGVAATATDSTGNTSEFSACVTVK